MDIELRPATEAESEAFLRAGEASFGAHLTDDDIEDEGKGLEWERSLACFDAGRIVATAAAHSLMLTVPGVPGAPGPLPVVPAAGVTWVGVLPTHRRRGLLTQMMTCQLEDVAAGHEPLAILTASEAGIYGRFGYGPASYFQGIEIDAKRARLAPPVADDGRMRLVGAS